MSYSRWLFTLNNYSDVDPFVFSDGASLEPELVSGGHDSRVEALILCLNKGTCKRGIRAFIIGFENAPTTRTPHLQGYVEFSGRVSLTGARRYLSKAHWEVARGTSDKNYRYCSKDGKFAALGLWERKANGTWGCSRKGSVHTSVMRGLLGDAKQDYIYEERYLQRKSQYDEWNMEVRLLMGRQDRFRRYSQALLSDFQMQVVRKLHDQSDRQVLWVSDLDGGTGKSFLAHFLNACYDYELIDGVTRTADVAHLLSTSFRGIVFDVTRSSAQHFNYSTLESCKNGFIMSGKYKGIKRIFNPVPVAVFANFYPDKSQLSSDRWDILEIHNGIFKKKDPVHKAQETYPFCPPKTLHLPEEGDDEENKENEAPGGNENENSETSDPVSDDIPRVV